MVGWSSVLGAVSRRRTARGMRALAVLALALAVAGCGGAMEPSEVPGEPAPELEARLEGLRLPRGAERLRVITDHEGRSISHYLVSDANLAEIVEFHMERLTDGGWEESRRSSTETEGEPAARLRFGREPFESTEGVESMRYRLTVDLAQDGEDVLMIWSVLDQQTARGGGPD